MPINIANGVTGEVTIIPTEEVAKALTDWGLGEDAESRRAIELLQQEISNGEGMFNPEVRALCAYLNITISREKETAVSTEPTKLDIPNLYIDQDAIGTGAGIFTFPNSTWGANDMYSYMLGKLDWHWNLEDDDAGPSTTAEFTAARNDWQMFEIEFNYETAPGVYYIPEGIDHWLVEKEYLTGYSYTIRQEVEDGDSFDWETLDSGTHELSSMADLNALLDRLTAWLNESTEPAEISRQQRRKREREAAGMRDK